MNSAALSEISSLFGVKGLVAVVTGGGTGIGLMMATALENNGAIVYVVSRNLEVLEKAASIQRHSNIFALRGDVTDRDSLREVAATIKERHGYINLLINNAGTAHNILPPLPTPDNGDIKAYQDTLWNAGGPEDFARSFDVNVTGPYYCTVAFLELLHAGNASGYGGGTSQVITVASGGAFRKDDKVFSVSYTVSKAAATHLGKMLAHFLRDWKIRSNVIAPGIFPSQMTDGLISNAYIASGVPIQREGNIDDIGGLVLFLASKAGSYVNGAVHLLDGGRLLLHPSNY